MNGLVEGSLERAILFDSLLPLQGRKQPVVRGSHKKEPSVEVIFDKKIFMTDGKEYGRGDSLESLMDGAVAEALRSSNNNKKKNVVTPDNVAPMNSPYILKHQISKDTDVVLKKAGYVGSIFEGLIDEWWERYYEEEHQNKQHVVESVLKELQEKGCRFLINLHSKNKDVFVETEDEKLIRERIRRSLRKKANKNLGKNEDAEDKKVASKVEEEEEEEEDPPSAERETDPLTMLRDVSAARPTLIRKQDLSTKTDVILGFAGWGGELFRDIMEEYWEEYDKTPPYKKIEVVETVYKELKKRGCRFLGTIDKSKKTFDASVFVVVEDFDTKIRQRITRSLRKKANQHLAAKESPKKNRSSKVVQPSQGFQIHVPPPPSVQGFQIHVPPPPAGWERGLTSGFSMGSMAGLAATTLNPNQSSQDWLNYDLFVDPILQQKNNLPQAELPEREPEQQGNSEDKNIISPDTVVQYEMGNKSPGPKMPEDVAFKSPAAPTPTMPYQGALQPSDMPPKPAAPTYNISLEMMRLLDDNYEEKQGTQEDMNKMLAPRSPLAYRNITHTGTDRPVPPALLRAYQSWLLRQYQSAASTAAPPVPMPPNLRATPSQVEEKMGASNAPALFKTGSDTAFAPRPEESVHDALKAGTTFTPAVSPGQPRRHSETVAQQMFLQQSHQATLDRAARRVSYAGGLSFPLIMDQMEQDNRMARLMAKFKEVEERAGRLEQYNDSMMKRIMSLERKLEKKQAPPKKRINRAKNQKPTQRKSVTKTKPTSSPTVDDDSEGQDLGIFGV
jgi:hypothetical protein